VGGGHLAGQGADEAPVVIAFLGGRLAINQRYRIAEVPEPVVPEFFGRVVPGVVHLGLGCHDLIQELAIAVLGARFAVGLRHRDRLAEHSAARRGDHDQAGGRRTLQHDLPFLG